MTQSEKNTGILTFQEFEEKASAMLAKSVANEYMIISFEVDQFAAIIEIGGKELVKAILGRVEEVMYPLVNAQEGIICRIAGCQYIALAKQVEFSDLEDRFYSIEKQSLREILKTDNVAQLSLNVSAGVYFIRTGRGHLYQYMEYSEIAKNMRKHEFGSTLVEFTHTMHDKQKDVNQVISKMQKALVRREFVPYLQPKVNLVSRKTVGAEILVRWVSETGLVPAGTFIPVMEENGFITSLDFYMFEETCKVWKMLVKEKVKGIDYLSVNLSRITLLRPDLIEKLSEILGKYQLDANRIELEITESAFVDCQDIVTARVRALREVGFYIAIDDFGSHYSTLTSLLNLEANTVKLDRAFISALITQKGMAFLSSMIITFQNAGFHLVFEGIETNEQHDIISDFGCDTAQGYLYGRPMPFDDFVRYTKEH